MITPNDGDPYRDDSFWEEMQPGQLIPGERYSLVINEFLESHEVTPYPMIRTNMEFIRYNIHPRLKIHVLEFGYENNNYTIVVKWTTNNKFYRLKTVGDYTQPGSIGSELFKRTKLSDDPYWFEVIKKFGGKRKNNKKKTHGKKKTTGKKAKSLRKRKSVKKNKKNML